MSSLPKADLTTFSKHLWGMHFRGEARCDRLLMPNEILKSEPKNNVGAVSPMSARVMLKFILSMSVYAHA